MGAWWGNRGFGACVPVTSSLFMYLFGSLFVNREHAAGRVHRPNRGALFSCFGACLPPFPPFCPPGGLLVCFPRVCCWSAPHRSSSSAFCVLILRSLPFVSLGGVFVSSAPIDDGGGIVGNVPPLASLVEKRGARSSSLAWGMTTTATGMLLGRGGMAGKRRTGCNTLFGRIV